MLGWHTEVRLRWMDFIYNANTKIEAQTKVISAGPDPVYVWFKVQEI